MSNCSGCHTAFPFSQCAPNISSGNIYYSGPNLPCSGIINKDSITTAIQKIDAQLCGENLVNNVFSAILNDADLYQQFVELVNGAIDCTTIQNCLTTTTTTTIDTSCIEISVDVGVGCEGSSFAVLQFTSCSGDLTTTLVSTGDLPNYCVRQFPAPVLLCGGAPTDIQIIGPCSTTTTTTTTTP